ncbi:MAG: hypothetical protein V4760_10420 [Bdellovibrionota bacterium]
MRFALVKTFALLSLTILTVSPGFAGESCGFKKTSALERAAVRAIARAGRHIPCAACESPISRVTPGRDAIGPLELEAQIEFDRILSDPSLAVLNAQGDIRLVFGSGSSATYPHTLLLNREVVIPEIWISKRSHLPQSREMLRFVVAHEIGHLVYESTFSGLNPDPNSMRDHLLVDAIGARLAGFSIEDVRDHLARTIVAGAFNGDIPDRVACLSRLKKDGSTRAVQ